ncbi:MAG: helix-turn-helix transcriptional regulator [Rhodospirillales bacterium]|nr:helix-turn-helix transcriptional regulator [Rhodospirillales bacterium]MCB9973392.1 helix-turn-helix transcriptional regulator [Rhodospirillales bacterium]
MITKSKTKGRVADYDKEIGIRLRALRKLNNHTQESLARQLDITFQQVQKYEQGTNRISASKLKQIIDFFEIPASYFFETNKQAQKIGFAESSQEPFAGPEEDLPASEPSKTDIFQTPETINLLKAYYSIKDAKARKGLLRMVKTYAENVADAQKTD